MSHTKRQSIQYQFIKWRISKVSSLQKLGIQRKGKHVTSKYLSLQKRTDENHNSHLYSITVVVVNNQRRLYLHLAVIQMWLAWKMQFQLRSGLNTIVEQKERVN